MNDMYIGHKNKIYLYCVISMLTSQWTNLVFNLLEITTALFNCTNSSISHNQSDVFSGS